MIVLCNIILHNIYDVSCGLVACHMCNVHSHIVHLRGLRNSQNLLANTAENGSFFPNCYISGPHVSCHTTIRLYVLYCIVRVHPYAVRRQLWEAGKRESLPKGESVVKDTTKPV